jgi:hypothetical protein
MFSRYNIVDQADAREAMQRLDDYFGSWDELGGFHSQSVYSSSLGILFFDLERSFSFARSPAINESFFAFVQRLI